MSGPGRSSRGKPSNVDKDPEDVQSQETEPETDPGFDPPALQEDGGEVDPEPEYRNIRIRRSSMTLTRTEAVSFHIQEGAKPLYAPLVLRLPAAYAEELVRGYPSILEFTEDAANTTPEDLKLSIPDG